MLKHARGLIVCTFVYVLAFFHFVWGGGTSDFIQLPPASRRGKKRGYEEDDLQRTDDFDLHNVPQVDVHEFKGLVLPSMHMAIGAQNLKVISILLPPFPQLPFLRIRVIAELPVVGGG